MWLGIGITNGTALPLFGELSLSAMEPNDAAA